MTKTLPRFLLLVSAAIFLFGGAIHARAFKGTLAAVAASNLPVFYANSLKGLWLIDSATLVTLGIVFGLVGIRPLLMTGGVISLLALIPASTAGLVYYFIGPFPPVFLLMSGAVFAFVAGLLRANPGQR